MARDGLEQPKCGSPVRSTPRAQVCAFRGVWTPVEATPIDGFDHRPCSRWLECMQDVLTRVRNQLRANPTRSTVRGAK